MIKEIVDRITDGLFAIDRSGYCIYANQKARQLLNLAPGGFEGDLASEGVEGVVIWDHFHGDAEKQLYAGCQKAMSSQQYLRQEINLEKDGQWLEYHLYPSATGLSVLFQDITERKKEEEEWKTSDLRYRALIEQASDPIMITDDKGNFLEANSSLCKLFGYSKEELLELNIASLLDPEELKEAPIQFAALAAGQPVLRDRRMVHKDGTIIEVESNVKRTPDGRLLAIARDITERKKAAKEILREKEILNSIINSLPGVFLIREIHGKILRWNRQLEIISGYSAAEIPELPAYHFFEDENKQYMRQRVERLMREGKSSSEVVAVSKSGHRVPFFLTAMMMPIEEKSCLLVIGIDITERKKAEEELQRANEQLRHLSAHLHQVREEERKRIALEIHDELGQQLTALKMDLSWALNKSSSEGRVFDKLSGMNKLIDQTIVTVRRISSELRPSILDDLGLADALIWQSIEFEKRYHIISRFYCPVTDLNINSSVVTALFRIYQESLTNVARHSQAKTVLGSLKMENDHLVLQVTDDGKGFDPQATGNKVTFGLMGIKERTLMMGGEYSILSGPDKGTVITVSVPIHTNQ
jgi:PAS domain S-box-containing protein